MQLPPVTTKQFDVFREICLKVKRLADRTDPGLLEHEWKEHGVTAPKAIDNAIVNYVRLNAQQTLPLIGV